MTLEEKFLELGRDPRSMDPSDWGFPGDRDYSDPHWGRVVEQRQHYYSVALPTRGIVSMVELSGAFEYRVAGPEDYPIVGDWVVLDPDFQRIQMVLERRTAIRRSVAGSQTQEQLLAANVDLIIGVFGLDGGRNFLPRLVERISMVVADGGCGGLLVLNKADCAPHADAIEQAVAEAREAAPHLPVLALSAHMPQGGAGFDPLSSIFDHLAPGSTALLLGKSGVGKSALVNGLSLKPLNNEGTQRRGDKQGRHTTTWSTLVPLGSKALLIDSPGIRALKLWSDRGSAQENLYQAFPDIALLAQDCHFDDCSHGPEPNCAVLEAVGRGELSTDRFGSYQQMAKELGYIAQRQQSRGSSNSKDRWKSINKQMRKYKKPGR